MSNTAYHAGFVSHTACALGNFNKFSSHVKRSQAKASAQAPVPYPLVVTP
jgi:hypothetical protein